MKSKKRTSPIVPFQNAMTSKMHQIWYDDAQSLKLRSDYAVKMNMRGVGIWTADSLDYSNTTQVGTFGNLQYSNTTCYGWYTRHSIQQKSETGWYIR